MQHRPVIDAFEFARAGSKLSGEWAIADFARLRDALHARQGSLHYELQGIPEQQGRPALRLQVIGTLQLICQRCLGALEFALRTDTTLLLYASELEVASLPVECEGPEAIAAGRETAVHGLIEEEVLLAIPLAPRHEQCAARPGVKPDARPTPFAGLRGLLGGKRE